MLLQSRSEIIYVQHKLFARLRVVRVTKIHHGHVFVKLTLQSKDESRDVFLNWPKISDSILN